MKIEPLSIQGAWIASSPVFGDNRGFFREWFKSENIFSETGLNFGVAQANISSSRRGTVRGIHYSLAEVGQAKWVTCVTGAIRDVIVDIRPNSHTYGQYEVVDLSGVDGTAVLIGAGLGHGFISLADASIVAYLVSSPYSPTEEFEINPLDPKLGIEWGLPLQDLSLSDKDRGAPTLEERRAEGKLPE